MIGNYKPLIQSVISDTVVIPDMTMGEFMYTLHRYLKKKGYNMSNPADVLSISDEDFYECVCKVKNDIIE